MLIFLVVYIITLIFSFVNDSNTDAIMVGGSTVADPIHFSNVVLEIKACTNLPVIIFPNNVASITKYADAIWFMSLLNSMNVYYIIGAQMLAAPLIKKYGIEPLSMAYIVVGEGKTAGFIGQANPIPLDKPELALAYALAAEMLGFEFVYLEAGSGATKPIPPEFVSFVRKGLGRCRLIVGGGIREPSVAYHLAKAGADIIVTGTILTHDPTGLKEIVRAIKKAGREKKTLIKPANSPP
ncbi:MAG: geranylgeranylglyceryl/heptaprenylglyceryl phosphate synthase [Candidatus Geothermarchaeota archaeon]